VTEALEAHLRLARRGERAAALHGLADRTRLLALSGTGEGADADAGLPASGTLQTLERRLRATWEAREEVLAQLGTGLAPDEARRLRTDLLELAIFGAKLRVRLAPPRDLDLRRHEALAVLAEAEALLGPSPVIERERQSYAESLGLTDMARASARRLVALTSTAAPISAWEHDALGRSLLDAGDPEAALREFAAASELQPEDPWPHLSRGLCAYRLGRYDVAAAAFDVCVALAPRAAESYYNRARAHAALGRVDRALRDYEHALSLDPGLAIAALNRGALLLRAGRYPEAIADLRRALAGRASPATAHYNLALAYLAQGDRGTARECLASALRLAPGEEAFRTLERRLLADSPAGATSPSPR
jgi:tetratricopeptide (TPR) repeat protein